MCVCVRAVSLCVCTFAPVHNVGECVRMLYNDEIKSPDVSVWSSRRSRIDKFSKFTHNYSLTLFAVPSHVVRVRFVRKFLEIKQK